MLLAETSSPALWPAIWSAVAATGSLTTAVITLLINRRNSIDAVRPILVLDSWALQPPTQMDKALAAPVAAGDLVKRLVVQKISNIGRGPAPGLRVTLKVENWL